jgi:hypothetical protein
MEYLRQSDVSPVRNTGLPKWGDPYGDGIPIIVGGVTTTQGDGNAVHRAKWDRVVSWKRNLSRYVEMLPLTAGSMEQQEDKR